MADVLRLEFGAGAAVEWDLTELMHAADAADPQAPPAWRLDGEPDWERISSLRLVVGAVGEQALAAAVARPAASPDHGADGVALALVSAEGADAADEVLLSTEYDPEGEIRRLGLEVWLASGAGKRIAADRVGEATTGETGGLRRTVTPVEVRLDGERGRGLHELIQLA